MSTGFESLDRKIQSAILRLDNNLNIFANLQKRAELSRQEFDKISEGLRTLESDMKETLSAYEKQFSGLLQDYNVYIEDMYRLRDRLLSAQKELLAFADKRIEDHREEVNSSLKHIGKIIDGIDGKIAGLDCSNSKLRQDIDSAGDRLDRLEKRLKTIGIFAFLAIGALCIVTIAIFVMGGR